jgi:hypothetical protein
MEWLLLGSMISLYAVGISSTFNGLFFVIGNNLSANFKILQLKLSSLDFESTDENSQFDEVKELVELQIRLLKLCEKFKSFFAFMMFTSIILSTLLNSVQGLIFVTASENAKRIGGISYVVVAIIVLAIIHYIPEKIDNESGLVAQAAYDSDWYKASPKIKKALLLIMMRSHASFKIKLWFYEFNMNTYTAVSIE